MKNTGYDHNDGSLATGYTGSYSSWEKADYFDMTIPFAAKGLYSTVEDLYRRDQVLYTERLISQDVLNLMFTPRVKIPNGNLSYAYAWTVGELNSHQVVRLRGGIEGFASEFRRYPDDKVTIIVLSNRDTTDVFTVADQIAQVVFGE
jgi:CubicO group peptidase (beta-lactamase class C family)